MRAEEEPSRRLIHYTPLRYPGGKSKLAPYIKSIIERNDLIDGHYAEPYAGGAGVALELLFHEYVSHIHINDFSRPIYAFWKSILDDTDRFLGLVKKTKLSVAAWDKQKKIISNFEDYDDLRLGFATFFLNRTNRSGILNGGIIGGRDQAGPWKIDARFNTDELIFRIESIAKMRRRISLSGEDALFFLKKTATKIGKDMLVYLDPPYYVKGKDLYLNYYSHDDHIAIARAVKSDAHRFRWVVSYDNVPAIRKMYAGCSSITYKLNYSARDARTGSEVIFFCSGLRVPDPTGLLANARCYLKRDASCC